MSEREQLEKEIADLQRWHDWLTGFLWGTFIPLGVSVAFVFTAWVLRAWGW